MKTRGERNKSGMEGVTLLELTFAIAILAVAIGVVAQCLVSYYSVMNTQRDRVVAINHARQVLNDMRAIRDAEDPTPKEGKKPGEGKFKDKTKLKYPPGQENKQPGPGQLKKAFFYLEYEESVAEPNLLRPTVTETFEDMKGREIVVSVATAISTQ